MIAVSAVGRSLAACLIALPVAVAVGAPAHARPVGDHQGQDTHITAAGSVQTIDCHDSTLHVNGTGNTITAFGTCWAVTVQGANNIVVAHHVINDITVYGYDQTVLFHNGEPFIWDRGRELGMTNRIDRVPA
ncbi:MAG: DUF3060 domain-containing protein [Mycobacterium sp.]